MAQLNSGEVPTHIERDGGTMRSAGFCDTHIGRGGLLEGHVNQDDQWLCQTCFERYGQPRDLAFIFAISAADGDAQQAEW